MDEDPSPPPCISEIIDGRLYLGNLSANLEEEYRTKLGITHVVSVCPDCPPTENPNHLTIAIHDSEYEDILTHIPRACEFIENALSEEGSKVLVHCVMGVSRSATIVAAYLMKTRDMDVTEALKYIKERRRQILPNYGFVKQLEVYSKCRYDPKSRNPAYRSWKRRYAQDVRCYMTHLEDVATIVPERLFMASDFPEDEQQGRHLLEEFGITHLVIIGSSKIPGAAKELGLRVHEVPVTEEQKQAEDQSWTKVVPGISKLFAEAINEDGRVLVYSKYETKACVVICAYLMTSKKISSQEALAIIQQCLPLFTPTETFLKKLSILDTELKFEESTDTVATLMQNCKIQEADSITAKPLTTVHNRVPHAFQPLLVESVRP